MHIIFFVLNIKVHFVACTFLAQKNLLDRADSLAHRATCIAESLCSTIQGVVGLLPVLWYALSLALDFQVVKSVLTGLECQANRWSMINCIQSLK